MLRVTGLKLPLEFGIGNDPEMLARAAAKALGVPRGEIRSASLARRSVDARKKSNVHFVASALVEMGSPTDEALAADRSSHAEIVEWPQSDLLADLEAGRAGVNVHATDPEAGRAPDTLRAASGGGPRAAGSIHESSHVPASDVRWEGHPRPVVVGSGPAGLFCALALACAGGRPIVVERGPEVSKRAEAISHFERTGELDPEANVQFGEGGAGTYSDGKLTTGVSSPLARTVLSAFCDAGAPEEIMWQAKPHIGTDLLPEIVRSIRKRIESLGGDFMFETRLAGFSEDASGALAAARLVGSDGSAETLPADRMVLAIGHSARDTYGMLHAAGVMMTPKPFSIGVRIEHPQEMVDEAQYGRAAGNPALGPADYKLSCHLKGGRSAYTFCMCPGGQVVAAASEPGGLVVNGMSRFARDGVNANSALLVGIGPEDFGGSGPLAGVEFQKRWERAAFELGGGGYEAPAQLVGDLLAGRTSSGPGAVTPSYPLGVRWASLEGALPRFAIDSLAEALPLLGRRLRGFDRPDAVLTGIESRSSAPLRITRDETMQSSVRGLFPCGEGAGYAGGIMSSAIDGLRCALALMDTL